MAQKYLIDAIATLPNKDIVIGPIVTSDDEEYLFVNKHSALDFYLTLKKSFDGWYQSGGQT